MTPLLFIEPASSRSASSLKSFLGWYSFGTMRVSSSSITTAACPEIIPPGVPVGISAPSPFPRAGLDMLKHLFRQAQVALRAPRADVVHYYRLPEGRRLGQADVPLYRRAVHLLPEVFPDLVLDLPGEVVAQVVHREQYPLYLQPRV